MEHIERAHPFRVTLSKIVVHGYHVYTVTCQCVEEYRECTHKCFTFTRCHFGNFSLVQYHTTEELHVIVHHVPLGVVATSYPVVLIDSLVAIDGHEIVACSQFAVKVVGSNHYGFVLSKTACRVLHNGKYLGQSLIECHLHFVEHLCFEFIDLAEDYLAVFNRSFFDFGFEFLNLLLNVVSRVLNGVLNLFSLGA